MAAYILWARSASTGLRRSPLGPDLPTCGVEIPHDHGLIGHSGADVRAVRPDRRHTSRWDTSEIISAHRSQMKGASSDLVLIHAGSKVADCAGR
jgi:2C-methyl-D-erythritol 2,4-cyclodiphosphate synthase